MNRALLPPAAFAGRSVLRLLFATYRLDVPEAVRRTLEALPRPCILAAWHDQSGLAAPYFCRWVRRRGLRIAVMVSRSGDGDLVTRVAEPLGFRVVRGSASRGGRQALRALYRETTREQSSPLVLPDGPRGPQHVVKPGVVVLSQMTGAPIQPLGFATSSAWHLGSWDRIALARPLARLTVATGEPVAAPRELGDSERDRLLEAVGASLHDAVARARRAL